MMKTFKGYQPVCITLLYSFETIPRSVAQGKPCPLRGKARAFQGSGPGPRLWGPRPRASAPGFGPVEPAVGAATGTLRRHMAAVVSVDGWVKEAIWKEKSVEKKAKIEAMMLDSDDWTYVPNDVQQMGSAEKYPCLHLVIPALEQVHHRWKKLRDRPEYSKLHDAIQAGMDSIETYYDRTSECDAYLMAMGESFSLFLEPSIKLAWCKNKWSTEEYKEAVVHLKQIIPQFKKRWEKLNATVTAAPKPYRQPKMSKKAQRHFGVSDDELESDGEEPQTSGNAQILPQPSAMGAGL
ncbi:hypothetical protein K438DRAFT_1753508 [Mycena galopus ATCC 62051]|nr:hypothetical protein K438DRAFT_1753508 [Mycena galopus ATCC 62051]